MTKPEKEDANKCNIKEMLYDALLEARFKGRVACGLYETAESFEKNPNLRGICILPKETLDNECLLFMMETFCRENNLPVIKVGDMVKLAENAGLKSPDSATGEELNCILIKTHISTLRRCKANRKMYALERLCVDLATDGKQINIDVE